MHCHFVIIKTKRIKLIINNCHNKIIIINANEIEYNKWFVVKPLFCVLLFRGLFDLFLFCCQTTFFCLFLVFFFDVLFFFWKRFLRLKTLKCMGSFLISFSNSREKYKVFDSNCGFVKNESFCLIWFEQDHSTVFICIQDSVFRLLLFLMSCKFLFICLVREVADAQRLFYFFENFSKSCVWGGTIIVMFGEKLKKITALSVFLVYWWLTTARYHVFAIGLNFFIFMSVMYEMMHNDN